MKTMTKTFTTTLEWNQFEPGEIVMLEACAYEVADCIAPFEASDDDALSV